MSLDDALSSIDIGLIGITRKWTGAWGETSWKAKHFSSRYIILAGMVPSMILLKIVSFWVVEFPAALALSTSELCKFLLRQNCKRKGKSLKHHYSSDSIFYTSLVALELKAALLCRSFKQGKILLENILERVEIQVFILGKQVKNKMFWK